MIEPVPFTWSQEETERRVNAIRQHCSPMIIGFGGSIAYGTNLPSSDIDIRGIYMNPMNELIGVDPDSEQYTNRDDDITIYSLKKMMHLLISCNPNTIELLGLRPEHYLYVSSTGQQILDYKEIFLSKKAIYTFGRYAKAQLNRLMNKSGRALEQIGANETRSIQKVIAHLKRRDGLDNIDAKEVDGIPVIQINESMDIELFMRIFAEIANVHTDYKRSTRNEKAIQHEKLAKHMMHLVRLYMMAIDILDHHEIITYRAKEHGLLMDIRNGKFLEDDMKTPTREFKKVLDEYTAKFDEAAETTTLPDEPDRTEVNKLMRRICAEEFAKEGICFGF